MLKRGKYLGTYINPERMAAWLPDTRRWPLSENKLNVYFMNECPEHWQCRDIEEFMRFLQESWADCFTRGDEKSEIRVKFEGMKTRHIKF